ncbi:hypothetical protein JCM9140_710 [Halalkalibacter wakoensis JCM 9140]|uniref:Uncharacterized protein n=1 Tax=Halalkalibacter wakoensis JCM 9140 TaxID=1236970 RepID=W4PZ42_9BACI|nr:hypothetical protein JCM9140_710 [Halalkalibacter wakoensis JCM 9140]
MNVGKAFEPKKKLFGIFQHLFLSIFSVEQWRKNGENNEKLFTVTEIVEYMYF